jgi:hypothetical protein
VEGPVASEVWSHENDSDGDGLEDSFETEQGLDPYEVDSDSDGVFDEADLTGDGGTWWDLQTDLAGGTDPAPDAGPGGGGGGCFISTMR